MRSVRFRLEPVVRRPLRWAAGWSLLASAACLSVFAASTIPSTPTGRDIPIWLDVTSQLLSIAMLPACAVIPLPLLLSARYRLGSLPLASTHWNAAWMVAGTAAIITEVLFIWRLERHLETPYVNVATPSWHALEFGIAYLAAGVAMMLVLVGAGRSASRCRGVVPRT